MLKEVGLSVGGLVDRRIERGGIFLAPKTVLDTAELPPAVRAGIKKGLANLKTGRFTSFNSVDAMASYLNEHRTGRAKKPKRA